MKYILDTDILIYILKGQETVLRKITNLPNTCLHTTIINHSELYFGAFNSHKIEKNLERIRNLLDKIPVLPFCEEASRFYAEIKAGLKREGKIIADLDLMIASISLKHKMVLVTNNEKHFTRIKKLSIENWTIN